MMNDFSEILQSCKLNIITVTRNASLDLEKTLSSIFSQKFTDYEVIIIDGMSTDDTVEIIKNYSDRVSYWLSEKDDGIYDAMNKALSVATGEYVQFLNAGDYYVNDSVLAEIFSNIQSAPTLIYGDIQIMHTDGQTAIQNAGEFTLNNLLCRGTGVLCHQAMFVKNELAPAYDTRYKYKGELNWYFDLVEQSGFSYQYHSIPVVTYVMGGFGYKHFIKNRFDWIRVLYRRYGLRTIYESRIIIFLLKNSVHRYPWLARIAKNISYMKSFCSRSSS